jgi:hypothetical protein
MRITKAAQDASQHLANNFQDFAERKLVEAHGGRESRNDFLGGGVALVSGCFSSCAILE